MKDEVLKCLEGGMRRECIIFFKYFLKFFFKFIIWLELSLFDCVTEDCLQKKNLIKYIDLLKDLI